MKIPSAPALHTTLRFPPTKHVLIQWVLP